MVLLLGFTATADCPLPGDLVISRHTAQHRFAPTFTITSWPQTDRVAGPYQSYGYALRQARELAARRQVRVWRDHSLVADRPELEDVTEEETR
jgi:hypothetical protein